jgi:urease accessory protein
MTMKLGWKAHLCLEYAFEASRTVLRKKSHIGPLVVQKVLYPEGNGVCHTIIVHPPGGILEGDQLQITAQLGANAHVLFTTPGATRWYKSTGKRASQQVHIKADADACIEWLPQETIYFEHTHAQNLVNIDLATGAKFIGWEIACLGRKLMGEQFLHGRVHQALRVTVDGRLVFAEQGHLAASDAALRSAVGFDGYAVYATFVAYAPTLTPVMLEQCRQCAASADLKIGLTLIGNLLVGRALGGAVEPTRDVFTQWWKIIRETVCQRVASPPRIWQT